MGLFDSTTTVKFESSFYVALSQITAAINNLSTAVIHIGDSLMATFQEVKDAVQAQSDAIDANTAEVGEAVVILGEVKAKLDELIAGGGATPAQLQEVMDVLTPATAKITLCGWSVSTVGHAAISTRPELLPTSRPDPRRMFPRHQRAQFRVVDDERQRLCTGCALWLAHDCAHFYRHHAKPFGLQSMCAECVLARCTAAGRRKAAYHRQMREYARMAMAGMV